MRCNSIFLPIWILLCLNAEAKQPNFLILLGDDISADSIGCFGSPNPNTTPNIDKLASEGIRFSNMFVSEAICAPARAELYTGLQPHRNGCMQNHHPTKKGTKSVVHHLKKLGYRVGLTGKRHFSPKSVYPFEFVEGFPQNCNAKKRHDENWGGVEEFMTRDTDQPFCLFICSIHAHAPWDAGDSSHWKLSDIKLPPHFADTVETRHYYREHLAEVRLFDQQVGKARALLEQHELDQTTAMLVLDENGAGMPCGKWSTYDWGVRSACVVWWPGARQHAATSEALVQYCDVLPTLIEAAGGKIPASLDGRSMLPLIAGKRKSHRDRSFFVYNSGPEGPPFATRAATDGRFKLIWNLTPDNQFAVRVINGFDYGYKDTKDPNRHVRKIYRSWLASAEHDQAASNAVHRFREQPEFQLFDLNSDPYELNNLAEDAKHRATLQDLKASISDWMKQQGDDGP